MQENIYSTSASHHLARTITDHETKSQYLLVQKQEYSCLTQNHRHVFARLTRAEEQQSPVPGDQEAILTRLFPLLSDQEQPDFLQQRARFANGRGDTRHLW